MESIGLLEVQALAAAIEGLDAMLKSANVRLIHIERRLGGRLVTVVIAGSVSAVTEAIEVGKVAASKVGNVKCSEVIARPHSEVTKFFKF
jgi:ethanolamine utilization protein EutM